MKDKDLVPKNTSPTQEIILPINHEKLGEALRKDMRRAAEELLDLHKALTDLMDISDVLLFKMQISVLLSFVNKALAALDCIDHIPVMSDKEDAIEAAIFYGLAYQVDPDKIENTVDALIAECYRITDEIELSDDAEHLETQWTDVHGEVERRQAHYGKIENTIDDLLDEIERLNDELSDEISDEQHDYLKMQCDDLENEIDRREDDDDVLENLVQDAIESGDTAVLKHDESELFCDVCGGFSGCACEGDD